MGQGLSRTIAPQGTHVFTNHMVVIVHLETILPKRTHHVISDAEHSDEVLRRNLYFTGLDSTGYN
jgi:hypothetical protein